MSPRAKYVLFSRHCWAMKTPRTLSQALDNPKLSEDVAAFVKGEPRKLAETTRISSQGNTAFDKSLPRGTPVGKRLGRLERENVSQQESYPLNPSGAISMT